MNLELKGSTAVVTGGSRGIGRAIAEELVSSGVSVAIAGRNTGPLEKAAKQLSILGNVIPIQADTSDDSSVKKLINSAISQLGSINILVNCAASVSWREPNPNIETLKYDEFVRSLNVKVMGYLRCAREVAPLMREQGWGRIINIAGMMARKSGSIIGSIRNVSVVALTKNLAKELGRDGINVTCIHPGTTRTDSTPELMERRASLEKKDLITIEREFSNETAIGRMVTAKDIAYLTCFLASPRSIAVQGDLIVADGGSSNDIRY